MIQYIDKSALVSEIDRRIKCLKSTLNDKETAVKYELTDLLSFLNTLEVKEVDLEKEKGSYIETLLTGTNPIYTKGGVSCIIDKTAKHFFELGLQVNNPITAADRGMAEEIIVNLKRVEQDYHIDLTNEMEWLRNKVKKGEE